MFEKEDLYQNYKADKYNHYRSIETGMFEKETVKTAKTGERLKPIKKQVKIPFEEVKALRLDSNGVNVPTLDTEDFTIVSNYLFDFWGAILGDSVISTYLHLKRHAYGRKDYCYIDIELISLKMGKSKNPVKGYLATLEEHGFIAMFLRKTVDKNTDASPLFKIRRYVPLITQEMYDSLHPKMKKLHDEYMKPFEDITFSTNLSKSTGIIEKMVTEGEVISTKAQDEKIEQAMKEGKIKEYIFYQLSDEQRDYNNAMQYAIEKKVSKPSYETWLKGALLIRQDDSKLTVLAPNYFASDWLERHYLSLIKEVSEELFSEDNLLIEVTTIESYIETLKA